LDDFLGQLPILLFTLIGGVVADRHDRRHLLLGSQFVQMTTAFILAGLIFRRVVRVEHILLLSFVAGMGQAFGGPAYQALIPSLVRKDHLPNAIALNSIQFNLARVIGPILAGATLAAWGGAACFALNGLSFLVVIVALLALTILAALTTFLGLPLLTFLPVFARDIFHGDINRFSHMMAVSGVGAVCGALIVAWLGRFRHMGLALLLVQATFGMLVVAFSLSRVPWVSYALLFCTGASLLMVFSMTSSLVQLIVPDQLRGRVVSIYIVA